MAEIVFSLDHQEMEAKLQTEDVLEKVTGSPSQQKAVKDEENRLKEKELKLDVQKPLMQQVGRSGKATFSARDDLF